MTYAQMSFDEDGIALDDSYLVDPTDIALEEQRQIEHAEYLERQLEYFIGKKLPE